MLDDRRNAVRILGCSAGQNTVNQSLATFVNPAYPEHQVAKQAAALRVYTPIFALILLHETRNSSSYERLACC